jgi:hypothetical protein
MTKPCTHGIRLYIDYRRRTDGSHMKKEEN